MAFSSRLYAGLPTERPNPRTRHIDRRSPLTIARAINREDALVALAVGRRSRAIARGMEILSGCLRQGGSVVFLGAGTSGRLAVLEAAECPPTFGTLPRQIRAVMAGGKASVFRSREGAEDDAKAGIRSVRGLGPRDAVVGIAASGVTPFVRAALKAARRQGCRTILVTSHGRPPDNPAELTISPEVGPEVVAGSTRMKAGTAAKLVLNALTTGTMILLGKVYDRWMVDLKPTSRKLRLRGERIIAELGKVSSAKAAALFKASGWSVKASVLMACRGISRNKARKILAVSQGSLRRALEA